jgi:competence protein ComEA
MSLDHTSTTASRASGVLEDLFRERTRRTLFRRDPADPPQQSTADERAPTRPTGEPPGAAAVPVMRRRPGTGLRVSPLLGVVGAAVVVVVAALGWRVLARPAPIEQRLPLTAAAPSGDAASSSDVSADGDDPTAAPSADADAAAPGSGGGPSGSGAGPVFVHVAGAVAAPGVVELPAASRVVDAVAAAGGLRVDADPDRVNLAAPLADGTRVVIPVVGEEPLPESSTVPAAVPGSGAAGGTSSVAAGASAPGSLLDLNRADVAQLDTLPGVGPSTAAAIVEHREQHGPFRDVDALLDVRGIGDAKLEALRDLVTVG